MKTIKRFFWTIFKLSVFAVIVLVIAHSVEWKGKTISDQVKTQMSQVMHSKTYQQAENYAKTLGSDIKNEAEAILPTEKEKLKNLIKDLNKVGH